MMLLPMGEPVLKGAAPMKRTKNMRIEGKEMANRGPQQRRKRAPAEEFVFRRQHRHVHAKEPSLPR
jgi:hypothetical protein